MSFASEAANLLTNKYFLYFIVFVAVTNIMGYIVTQKMNAVVFFVLVCILMINFSKNMTVVLIVAIVATNLLMANKSIREGMESGDIKAAIADKKTTTDDSTTTTDPSTTDPSTTDPSSTNAAAVEAAAQAFKAAGGTVTADTKTEVANRLKANAKVKKATTDATSTDPVPVDEPFTSAGSGFSGKKRGAIGGPAKVSRIDYSTTLEQAYDNLDKMLGSDGLNNLSADTEKLMAQQQKLFSAVNTMLPMIDKAQGMIQGLDMEKINSLVGMSDKFGSFGASKPKPQ
jgi:hypothetical protein